MSFIDFFRTRPYLSISIVVLFVGLSGVQAGKPQLQSTAQSWVDVRHAQMDRLGL